MEFNQNGFCHRGHQTTFGHLRTVSLSAEFDGRRALSDLSLDVQQGEIVGLLGRDGAGKTTSFEAIAGLLPLTSGRVQLNDVDVTSWPLDRRARSGLRYLPEAVSIFRGLSVEQNILLALEATESPIGARESRLETLLAQFELTIVRKQPATTVSGGERRRCEVARAMALEPAILLLDEPFRGLDPTSIASVRRMIGGLKERNIGVLVSDYDLRDLIEFLDRVYVLHEGQLIFSGTAAALLADSDVRHIYLGKDFSL